jgi:hypothetical protein
MKIAPSAGEVSTPRFPWSETGPTGRLIYGRSQFERFVCRPRFEQNFLRFETV